MTEEKPELDRIATALEDIADMLEQLLAKVLEEQDAEG